MKRCDICNKKGNWTLRERVFSRVNLCNSCANDVMAYIDRRIFQSIKDKDKNKLSIEKWQG